MRLSMVWILILCCGALAWAADNNTIDNNQIKLTYGASATTLVPGHKATLIIEIEPKAKMHLYAPGAKGYMPVEWKIQDAGAWTSPSTAYPPSHMLNLPAINETVPVYSEPFKLVRELTLNPGKDLDAALGADRTITVEGSVEYQACDDRLCYFPKTIPVKWTFKVSQ